jgi:hypothetical protein
VDTWTAEVGSRFPGVAGEKGEKSASLLGESEASTAVLSEQIGDTEVMFRCSGGELAKDECSWARTSGRILQQTRYACWSAALEVGSRARFRGTPPAVRTKPSASASGSVKGECLVLLTAARCVQSFGGGNGGAHSGGTPEYGSSAGGR